MNMVDLILTVCAIANPQACQDRHVLFESSGSLRSCMMQAEPYLAQWEAQHPGLRVAKWSCQWPDQEKENS